MPYKSKSYSSRDANERNTLRTTRVSTVLNRLFAAAEGDDESPRWRRPGLEWDSASALERADAAESMYMPISRQGGDLLYILSRARRPELTVEFGTSFGISTIYLAAATADNGAGRVISTELSATKATAARSNLDEAGLADQVTILLGDAMETLNEIRGSIDLVLLDGWKEMYVPLLQSLESRLSAGALIIADDTKLPSLKGYMEYVGDGANGYVSVAFPVEDGMQISCWTGDSTVAGGAL